MAHFVNMKAQYLLTTNFKVMYTTLLAQPSLALSAPRTFLPWVIANRGLSRRFRHYLLVRSPQRRLVSFFRDKFRQDPHFYTEGRAYSEWQDCQRIFFSALGISPDHSPIMIRECLLATSFDHFMEILPDVYRLEAHLTPQYAAMQLSWHGIRVAHLNPDRVLKIERKEDLAFIERVLALDISRAHNTTAKCDETIAVTGRHSDIIRALYRDDLERYGYV